MNDVQCLEALFRQYQDTFLAENSNIHNLGHETKSGVKFPVEASKLGDVAATGMLASSRCKLIMQACARRLF